MAKDIEIVSISSLIANSTFPVPTYDAGVRSVIGSTADGAAQLSSVATLQSWLKQNQYHTCTAGSTFVLSTAAVIRSITVIPASSAGGTVALSDGSTAVLRFPQQPIPRSLYRSA